MSLEVWKKGSSEEDEKLKNYYEVDQVKVEAEVAYQ